MDNGKLILVSGRSGSGKTSIINKLVELYPDFYQRPVSYTTREKRPDENELEYIFINKEKFESMIQKNCFFNVDCVYNNLYGIEKNSIYEITNCCKINAIKEIHPKNHSKIKELFDGGIIRLMINSNLDVSDNDRFFEDNEYYDAISNDEFDIIFFNDKNLTILENAEKLHMRIKMHIEKSKYFPTVKEIDLLNKKGYDEIANCFFDDKRITTRNFHELSLDFFKSFFSEFTNKEKKVLEIGPGNGWLIKSVNPHLENYTCLDISDNMFLDSFNVNTVRASARNMPFGSESFDIVVASLVDPYLYPEAICEISRIIKNGGYFAFSTPTKEWAESLRNNKSEFNTTKFISDNNEEIKVYSFTYSNEELIELMNMAGFNKIELYYINGEMLYNDVSPAIITAAQNKKIDYHKMNIISVGVFQKKG